MSDFFRITVTVGPLQCNCTIVGDRETGEAIVIDPGDEVGKILELVEREGVHVRAIYHTHGHIDHMVAVQPLIEATGARTHMHAGDGFLWEMMPVQARWLGMDQPGVPEFATIDQDDQVELRDHRGEVIHTPGHTPGSLCFHFGEEQFLLSGDTLFQLGIGRTDLPGGDHTAILRSIREQLFALPDETLVIPGHGPETSIALERKMNPFLN